MGCLFCNIIKGEIPSQKVYETDTLYAFDDINPQAPVHILIIPKLHIVNIDELTDDNSKIMAELFIAAKKIAELKGLTSTGYRVLINNGKAAGQVIWHLHLHLLGGADDLGPMISL